MMQYLALFLAIPLGYILAKTTSDEKQIFTKKIYFPTFLKILFILLAIFMSQNQQIALTLAFILITTYTWHKA